MKHKVLIIKLLLFVISLSYILITSSSATPTTRSFMKESNKEKPLFHEYLTTQEDGEKLEIGEGFIEGRMDFEKTDYSGVGANPEHDPKPPGKV
ncbi:Transmembrane protein [Parasponia andersonii]|uniref:Transmembrane protein n=1 Tax=Parasponia andersonii TaxID=3476 RepID=A0A2P5DNT2_PARAD|nr:Transmembrane protein [Parasponia andersonii]